MKKENIKTTKKQKPTGVANPVVGINKENKQVVRFHSINGVKKYGFDSTVVCRCVNHGTSRNSHKGYFWFTEKEFDELLAKYGTVDNYFEKEVYKIVGIEIATNKEIWFKSKAETKEYGFLPTKVGDCINGKQKQHGGYYWFSKENYKK